MPAPEPQNVCKCGSPIKAKKTKSGRCRRCFMALFNSDPAIKAKRTAGMQRYARDPATFAERSATAKRATKTRWANPFYAARTRKFMREVVQPLACTPEALASRDWVEFGKIMSDAKMSWCPEEYRDEYRRLLNKYKYTAQEARRIIEDQIAKDNLSYGPDELSQTINRLAERVAQGQAR